MTDTEPGEPCPSTFPLGDLPYPCQRTGPHTEHCWADADVNGRLRVFWTDELLRLRDAIRARVP